MQVKPAHAVFAAAAVLGLVLGLGGTAFAFGGCVDSPENPTWILAGIGGVAASASWLGAKLKRRKRK